VSASRSRLRRAGRGTSADGSIITWSVAEGRRGSRWREVRADDGAVISSLLLELDPRRRFSHLELATAVGLLTLHPEGDGSLHGNAVEATGVRHVVAVPWQPDDLLLVAGSPISRSPPTTNARARAANEWAATTASGKQVNATKVARLLSLCTPLPDFTTRGWPRHGALRASW